MNVGLEYKFNELRDCNRPVSVPFSFLLYCPDQPDVFSFFFLSLLAGLTGQYLKRKDKELCARCACQYILGPVSSCVSIFY